jgi:CHAT domain-containing protein
MPVGVDANNRRGPRIWWCLSGLLSFLPIHAAGHHATSVDSVPETVLDWVVSSYTPTVRALIYARRYRSADGIEDSGRIGDGGMMVVAMPDTPGTPALPGAEVEAIALRDLYPRRTTILTGPEAARARVLAVLPRSRWAHFACHAASEVANPSASRLLLFDHQYRPLTVVDVARLRLDDAELAFLSGCTTVRTSLRLADEAVHLASGFQLAGYRHVIATLWPIDDRLAARVASDFYSLLNTAGIADAAAESLHEATRRARQLNPARPSAWAAYIHSGA